MQVAKDRSGRARVATLERIEWQLDSDGAIDGAAECQKGWRSAKTAGRQNGIPKLLSLAMERQKPGA